MRLTIVKNKFLSFLVLLKEFFSQLLQFNQSKSARNVNFIMFLALFTCFYIVYMDVYML